MTTKRAALLLAAVLCAGALAACSSRDVARQQSGGGGEQPSAAQPAGPSEPGSGAESLEDAPPDEEEQQSSREESAGGQAVSITVNIRDELDQPTDGSVGFELRVPEGWQVSDSWNGQPSEGATIYNAQGDWVVQIPPGRAATQGAEAFSDIDASYPEAQSTKELTVGGYPAKLYVTAGDKYLNGEVVATGYYYDYYILLEDRYCSVYFFAPDLVDSEQRKFEDILSTFQLL